MDQPKISWFFYITEEYNKICSRKEADNADFIKLKTFALQKMSLKNEKTNQRLGENIYKA